MRITRPKPGEPIRLIETSSSEPRFRVVLDAGVKPDGKRRQITRTFRGLGEARAFVTETRASIRRGTFLAPNLDTFDVLAQRWLDSRRDIRQISRNGYANVLQAVRGKLGYRRVQDLRRSDVDSLVSWLITDGGQRGRGLSQRSVVYTLGAVKQVLGYAVAEGLIAASPAVGVRAPRKQRGDTREIQVWEPAELLRFRAVADADDWAAGWRLSLSGLRRSEVLGMRWGALDLNTGMVRVEAGRIALVGHRVATDDPKSAASWRTVPVESMHPGTVAILRGLSAHQAADRLAAGTAYEQSSYVLVDALGRPVRPEAYSAHFTMLCRQAGVPVVRLHSVRHTLALMMHRAGQAPADVAALLGHTVSVHVGSYVPLTERGAQTAASALGQVLAAGL